jgi:hypothetical protein
VVSRKTVYTAAESCAEKIERRLVRLGGGAALGGSRQAATPAQAVQRLWEVPARVQPPVASEGGAGWQIDWTFACRKQ